LVTSQKNRFPVSHSDDVSSHPDAHLSIAPAVRTTCHTIWMPDRSSIIRLDDVYFRLDPSLHREASVRACIHLDDSAVRPDDSTIRLDDVQCSTELQILSKFIYGKITATVRTTWIPIRTRSYVRQESQFKYNRPNVSELGPNARSTNMKIVYSTSTVRTSAYHGPEASSFDMEIAC
jgi:hypothetical protein